MSKPVRVSDALKRKMSEYTKDSIYVSVRMASRALTRRYDEQLTEKTGLRTTQLAVLHIVAVKSPARMTELADFLVMERSTFSRAVVALEREQLLTRVNGPGKRKDLEITEKGLDLLISNKEVTVWMREDALELLGGSAPEGMIAALKKLAVLPD